MQHGITENVEHEGLLAAVQQALTTGETPDAGGHYGSFGGRFVPETLFPALVELEAAFREAVEDPAFHRELAGLLAAYVGRPTPVTEARRLSQAVGGARILLKREDLNHTGAHKINNALGQALLAKRMGKERITAETGAGQHGVATATAAALLGLECDVFMGARDMARQELNVFRMRLLGARVIPVEHGTATLKEAVNEAIRDWVARVRETHYCIGSAVGPHPYPWIVQRFQAIIGVEARRQVLQLTGRLPDAVVACVGGGSNAIGIFSGFLDDGEVALVGVEAGGRGLQPGAHAASLVAGRPGVLHGSRSYLLQDEDGQVQEAHSVSAGLDYPGVGPEHAWLKEQGRAQYVAVSDTEALEAFRALARLEGIVPALESAHAVAYAARLAATLSPEAVVLVNVSGRGDKDVAEVARLLGGEGGEP